MPPHSDYHPRKVDLAAGRDPRGAVALEVSTPCNLKDNLQPAEHSRTAFVIPVESQPETIALVVSDP